MAVIGGGVMGASVAYHLAAPRLARRGRPRPRRRRPAPGAPGAPPAASARSTPPPINVRLSLLAREKLRRFADETGVDPGYAPARLSLARRAAPASSTCCARAGAVQHAEGLTEAVGGRRPRTSRRLNPAVRLDGVVGGAFCPTDGFIRPLGILEGYLARRARGSACAGRWGVEVRRAPARAGRPDRRGRDRARARSRSARW